MKDIRLHKQVSILLGWNESVSWQLSWTLSCYNVIIWLSLFISCENYNFPQFTRGDGEPLNLKFFYSLIGTKLSGELGHTGLPHHVIAVQKFTSG